MRKKEKGIINEAEKGAERVANALKGMVESDEAFNRAGKEDAAHKIEALLLRVPAEKRERVRSILTEFSSGGDIDFVDNSVFIEMAKKAGGDSRSGGFYNPDTKRIAIGWNNPKFGGENVSESLLKDTVNHERIHRYLDLMKSGERLEVESAFLGDPEYKSIMQEFLDYFPQYKNLPHDKKLGELLAVTFSGEIGYGYSFKKKTEDMAERVSKKYSFQ